MKYYVIEPEVAGGLGESTVMDRSVHPPKIARLQYEFDGWLGGPDASYQSFSIRYSKPEKTLAAILDWLKN